ncbi:MAG: histidine ammonia-lyase [Planctomycetota bacterium]
MSCGLRSNGDASRLARSERLWSRFHTEEAHLSPAATQAELEIGAHALARDELLAIIRGVRRLSLSPPVLARVARARAVIERVLASGEAVYGVNTGFGKLARVRIPPQDLERLQENLLLSHACGVGPCLPLQEARAVLALRIVALAQGYSGVRAELLERLLAIYNGGLVPAIPEQGSVGASGDLAPLAHMALLLLGKGEVVVDGAARAAAPLLASHGLAPLKLAPKEGLALINGTQVSTAITACAWSRACSLATQADLAAACTLEALKGSIRAFDPRIQRIRPYPGHAAAAANVRRLLEGSEILVSHQHCDKVQDQYSLRCVPQVHGACRDLIEQVERTLLIEASAVTDNPLVFPDEGEVLSGGNFHAEPVAFAADILSIAVAELASISERRTENLVNPDLSGLPAFLAPTPGINSGLMMAQVTAAALVSENKTLCHPASVDSIPTSANKEDHVSMAPIAARKARAVVANAERVLAIELLAAAQALDFESRYRPGRGVAIAHQVIRERVPRAGDDRLLALDIAAVHELVESGELLARLAREGVELV